MTAPVLVTGATGRQGGAVARHLLSAGAPVRALTRRPESDAARALAAAGARVARDLEDAASLDGALEGAAALFSVQDFWQAGADGEVRQARNVLDAAARAGVGFVLQSTVATPRHGGGPRVEHVASKRAVEDEVRRSGLAHALLGTVYFMDNVLDPSMGGPMTFPALGSLRPDTPLDLAAVGDLGMVAAHVLLHPDRFDGARVDVAGDRLTVSEMRAAYRRASGRRPKRWRMPRWTLRLANREFARQLDWHAAVNFAPDLEPSGRRSQAARRIGPLRSFEEFVRESAVTGP